MRCLWQKRKQQKIHQRRLLKSQSLDTCDGRMFNQPLTAQKGKRNKIMKTIIEYAKDKPVETQMKMSWAIVETIDTQKDRQTQLADGSSFSVMLSSDSVQVATNGLSAVVSSPDALRLAADLRENAIDGGACEGAPRTSFDNKHILAFTRTPEKNADDQMILSTALSSSVCNLEDISTKFVDGLEFDVYWEEGDIVLEIGSTMFPMSQGEALHQAAMLRQAALDAGAAVDCS